ncbi:MAG TPA: hypothetical protein VFV38_21890 [Ktedonobacteraceae bacterium]|nr:hypothetical protein [Ktedonobacteraceae bacterium]
MVEQVEQGSCQTLAVAHRLRFKLYHFYENPLILHWVFFEGDPGGLPDWWWRFSWEEPDDVRVCVLEGWFPVMNWHRSLLVQVDS